MQSTLIKKLSIQVNNSLPGKIAQNKMLVKPKYKQLVEKKKNATPAAVLILLYPNYKEWCFFLTKRTNKVEHHKGQISLPGGVIEKNESSQDAAIRETYEEIGIPINQIKIIGALTPYHVPTSHFEIYPYIGWIKEKPKTKIHELEVDRLLSISIHDLVLEKNYKIKQDFFSKYPIQIPYFQLSGEIVWGATSVILSEFRFILKKIL